MKRALASLAHDFANLLAVAAFVVFVIMIAIAAAPEALPPV